MFPFHQGKAYIGSHCSAGEKQRWSPKQMVLAAARNVPREKAMATHSSTLAWKIPWTEELLGCNPGVAKSRTRLSNSTFHFHVLEKEMASHSCVLAWRIPRTGEPGGLPSMGSHRVGHDWSDLAAVTGMSPKSPSWGQRSTNSRIITTILAHHQGQWLFLGKSREPAVSRGQPHTGHQKPVSKSGVQLLPVLKPIKRPSWWKERLALFQRPAMKWGRLLSTGWLSPLTISGQGLS